ncbi:MAG: hypothetical protein AUK35_09425 [Zetaproteobacteria bacterium CG2_30_46_52]|nr:MAG: hypothetical protein AUK35_09425 [Zetaproteobacteria bacterium CG2_30_46_52]
MKLLDYIVIYITIFSDLKIVRPIPGGEMGQKEKENNKRNNLICLRKSIFFSLLFMLFLGDIF